MADKAEPYADTVRCYHGRENCETCSLCVHGKEDCDCGRPLFLTPPGWRPVRIGGKVNEKGN